MFTVSYFYNQLKKINMVENPQHETVNKVTGESLEPHESAAGKKVDADLDLDTDQPEEDGDLITEESQKGKNVDGDPEDEKDQPTVE